MRNITFIACLACTLFSVTVRAQLFQNRIGKPGPREFGNSVTRQVDKTFLIGGSYRNTFYGKDFPAFVHLKTNGSVDWVRQLSLPTTSSAFVKYAEAVKSTTGTADGYIAVLNSNKSIFLVRLTNTGTVTWSRKLTNAAFSSNYVYRVKPAYSSATALPSFYILATHFSGLGEMVIKTNSAGTILWQKRITHPTSGSSYTFLDMKVTSDSGCVVTGYVSGGSSSNSVIFKFSPSGSVTFAKSYDFFSSPYDGGYGISQLTTGGYVVSGSPTFKVTSTGAITWGYRYTTSGNYDVGGNAVVTDAKGNIIITGVNHSLSSVGPAFLMELSSSGNITFSKEYDDFSSQFGTYNDVAINDLKLTSDGYCFAGTASPSNVLTDMFVVQTNTSGDIAGTCTPTTVAYTRVPAEFNSVVDASYLVADESLANTAVAITSAKITTQEFRCGTALTDLVADDSRAGTFSAYALGNAGAIKAEYKVTGTDYKNYDVKLYNLEGTVLATSVLQANQSTVLNAGKLQNGMYVVSLSSKGVTIAQQKIMISQ